jgi:hypothetical protein
VCFNTVPWIPFLFLDSLKHAPSIWDNFQ